MASFDSLLESLHSNAVVKDSAETYIEIDNRRQFKPSSDFDTTIAYEGDINSQIVVFKCQKIYDAHDLSKCQYKQLRWKNLTSGLEGVSDLTIDKEITNPMNLYWEVPSELCTSYGTIEISVKFYDVSDKAIVFSWNTSLYTGLSIGKSIDSVSFNFPPKNEILIIDKDTKHVVAPPGYNNVICNYGEVGVANVYFLINRYLGKNSDLDILGDGIEVYIYVIMHGYRKKQRITNITSYTLDTGNREKEGLVFINWKVPAIFTCEDYGANLMEISLEITHKADGVIDQRWISSAYSKLEVGSSLVDK